MSDAVMVPRERLIEIIGGEVCVMADHGDSIDPSSVEDAADAILKAFAASTPVGGWEDISTHDGSREPVLLWFPDFAPQGVVIGFYKAPEPDCYYPGQWVDDLTNEPFEVDKGEVFPSLWMPLPPPPSVSTGSRPQEAVPTGETARALANLDPAEFARLRDECRQWSGSAWLAGEKITAEERKRLQSEMYSWMCRAGSWFDWWHGMSEAVAEEATPQPADGCSSNEGAGK